MSATILPFVRPPHDALMAVRSLVPDTALTAELLGTERSSHAVQEAYLGSDGVHG